LKHRSGAGVKKIRLRSSLAGTHILERSSKWLKKIAHIMPLKKKKSYLISKYAI